GLSGSYGDEGTAVTAAFDRMAASLAEWDRSRARAEDVLKSRAGVTPGELALFYAEETRFDEAIRAMNAAIAAEPGRASLYVFKGLLQETAGHRSEAAQTFASASTADGTDPIAGYLAAARPTFDALSGERQQRVAAFMSAIAARPNARQKAPFVTYQLIDDLSSRVPVFAPAAYVEGFTLFLGGAFAEALAQFKAMLAQDPLIVDPAARNGQALAGVAALRQKRGAEAIKQLRAAVAALPDSSEAHRLLGVALRAVARLPESIRELESAVRLAPRDERSRVTLGSVLLEAGRPGDAERVLRQTVDMLPKSGDARWTLAHVYERLNRGLDAIALLDEAASLPVVAGKAALYWRVAELSHRYQEYDHVVAALTERVRLIPNEGPAHKALGLAHVRVGQNDEALAELLMATLLGVEDADTLTAIGQIHLGAERFDAAETTLRRAVALDPKHPQARYALGMTLTRMGRAEGKVHLDEFKRLRSATREEEQRQLDKQPRPAGGLR
ncbi:MAG TPA: tetratricopeptide repeat protein, partial [Burkholderiaceae bacterium]|nr:tetratricopeptide repeat protein [Burkholderiaceae bacterium]